MWLRGCKDAQIKCTSQSPIIGILQLLLSLIVCQFTTDRKLLFISLSQIGLFATFCTASGSPTKSSGQHLSPASYQFSPTNSYPSRPYFGVCGESPIYLLIGQGAVNVSTHYHSAILNDSLPCVLLILGKHFKNSLKNVLRPYSVNFLLHILKIQQLVICVPSTHHWITCDG